MNRYKLTKAGVDVNEGLKRLDNDKDFYEELLEKFCSDSHFAELKKAMEAEDSELAFKAAHALKGMAGNLSCIKLYHVLVPFVEKLRNHELEGALSIFPDVSEAYTAVLEAMGHEITE